MCRYAFHNYRDHFACFACRKAFKYWQWEECDAATWQKKAKLHHVPRTIVCPDCGAPMVDMGLDFKAPPRTAVRKWSVLEALASSGVTFHGCGCSVGVEPPKKVEAVPDYAQLHKGRSDGMRLLESIEKKRKARPTRRYRQPR